MLNVKLGPLEYALKITPYDGGEQFEVVTTPAMFAQVDEFLDTLRATRRHTAAWIQQKAIQASAMLAAQREGRFKQCPLTLDALAEFVNLFDYADAEVAEEADAGGEPDPTTADPAGGPAAE